MDALVAGTVPYGPPTPPTARALPCAQPAVQYDPTQTLGAMARFAQLPFQERLSGPVPRTGVTLSAARMSEAEVHLQRQVSEPLMLDVTKERRIDAHGPVEVTGLGICCFKVMCGKFGNRIGAGGYGVVKR